MQGDCWEIAIGLLGEVDAHLLEAQLALQLEAERERLQAEVRRLLAERGQPAGARRDGAPGRAAHDGAAHAAQQQQQRAGARSPPSSSPMVYA